MEKKAPIKISLSTFFLFLAIIVIIIMGYFIYKLYNEKSIATQEIADLNAQINNLENSVNNFQGKLDSISNTINSTVTENNSTNSSSNSVNSNSIKYVELTESLNDMDVLYVTKASKNSDDSYTLYGVVFKCNGMVNPEYQLPYTWTLTNEYKKLTIPATTTCISGYPEEKETTVGEYFKDYKETSIENSSNPLDSLTYSFEFKNGKCVKVIDYCTSI